MAETFPGTMKAVVRTPAGTKLLSVPVPRLSDDEVLIKVAASGLCRTDLFVARGALKVQEPRIPGHEFAGVVADKGCSVKELERGMRVAVMPLLPCLACPECQRKEFAVCAEPKQLGVHLDGSFAEYVKVKATAVYAIPHKLSFLAAAYAEPVAAALAVINAGLLPKARVLLYGSGRIAELTLRVLQTLQFKDVTACRDQAGLAAWKTSFFDAAVDTSGEPQALTALARAVRARGSIVLKSRSCQAASFDVLPLMQKEIAVRPVFYGSFTQALELLGSRELVIDDLIGPLYVLEDFEALLAYGERDESVKPFFVAEDNLK